MYFDAIKQWTYDWDEAKRASYLRKYDVDFADAAGGLEDPFGLTIEDDSEGETRHITLGMGLDGCLLYVVWTGRLHGLRLISARNASPGEVRHYSGN